MTETPVTHRCPSCAWVGTAVDGDTCPACGVMTLVEYTVTIVEH